MSKEYYKKRQSSAHPNEHGNRRTVHGESSIDGIALRSRSVQCRSFTRTTFLLGWWGTISSIIIPFLRLNNVFRYLSCLGMAPVPPGFDCARFNALAKLLQESVCPHLTTTVCAMSEPINAAVFISSSELDYEFVEREIIGLLIANGISPWIARRDVQSGTRWEAAIQDALQECPWFLVVLSKASVESNWVRAEFAWAVANRWPDRIVPVLIEDCDVKNVHLWLPQLQLVRFADGEVAWQKLLSRFQITGSRPDPTAILTSDSAGSSAISGDPSIAGGEVVRAPVFHFGGVVPPKYFIGREKELLGAERLIEGGHNFLLVGHHRDGKTSLIRMLIHRMTNAPDRAILPVYLNVQMWPDLTIETFLEHTILGMIGEISRQVFQCKYTSLNTWARSSPPSALVNDREFCAFLEIFRHVRERTYAQSGVTPAPFQAEEFLHIHADLLEIVRSKTWKSCVVFYDEANRLPRELSVDRLVSHEEALAVPGRMSVYAASPEMAETFLQLRQSFVHEVPLAPFGRADIEQLLACYYHGDASRRDLPVSDEALSKLVEFSKGRPYIVQLLAGNAFRLANRSGDFQLNGRHVIEAYQSLKNGNLTSS